MENDSLRNTKNGFHAENWTKEEVIESYTKMSRIAPVAAKKMLAAAGQNPINYSPLTRECMAALIFGMLGAISIEEMGSHETDWTGREMSLITCAFMGMEPEASVKLARYLIDNCNKSINPDLNENINQLIHYGIDLYYLLDQPERLEKAVHAILQACYRAFGTGEEN